MNDSNKWLVGIPGVGLLAVILIALVGGQPPTGKKDDPRGLDTPPSTTKNSADDPKTPRDYLTASAVLRENGDRLAAAEGKSVRFLVVALPDPAGSHLGYLYDQGADAIIRALGDVNYAFEGHWFPWEVVGEGKDKEPARRADSNAFPGVMVFRESNAPNRKMVVLIPGEDPVTGVRPKALREAFRLAASADEKIRVVAPNFTGSQPSLARAVRDWPDDTQRFAFLSGSASALRPWVGLGEPDQGPVVTRCENGVIPTTTIPVSVMRPAVLHYLANPGGLPTDYPIQSVEVPKDFRYARLVEGNTGFGVGAAAARKIDEGTGDEVPLPRGGLVPVVQIRFPLHVGRMAGVLALEQRARDERLGIKLQGRLSLTAADARRSGGDLLPAADEARTAALNMERLEQDWAVIRRERIRYVEVLATDPRDRLYLIQLLRANCPNAIPFMYNMDYLLGHPDYLPFTRGTVLATTYTLRPVHQEWTGGSGPVYREAFAINSMAGTYNAILAHLGWDGRMLEYAPPARPGDTRDRTRPPVWVTAVGENGSTVPLAYFTEYTSDVVYRSRVPAGAVDRPDAPHRPALRYLSLAVFAAAVWVVVLIGRATGRKNTLRPLVAGLRTMYATLAVVGAAFATVPPLLYFLTLAIYGWRLTGYDWLVTVLLSVVGLGVVGWVVYVVVPPVRRAVWGGEPVAAGGRPLTPADRPHGTWVLTATVLAVAVGTCGWVWAGHGLLDAGRHWLFIERAGELDTGASPVVTGVAFAAGFGLYGAIGLVVVRELARHRVPCPYPGTVPGSKGATQERFAIAAAEVGRRGADLDECLGSPEWVFVHPARTVPDAPAATCGWRAVVWHRLTCAFPWAGVRWSGVCLLGMVAVGCGLVLHRAHPTWETNGWNWLFAVAFLGLAFLTAATSYRLYLGWKGVERLTAAVLAVPMAGAFDRLPDKVGRLFGRYLLASRRRLRDRDVLLFVRDRAVAAMDAANSGRAAVVLRAYEQWLEDEAERGAVTATERGPDPDLEEDDVTGLCRLSERLVERLIPVWAADGRPVGAALGTVPVAPGHETPEPHEPGGWIDRAEQFVALMAVVYLSQYLVRMRRLAVMAAVASGSLLTAATAYQFQPEGLIMTAGLLMSVGVVGLIMWVLTEINRNELVSRVCRSTPNRFTLDGAFLSNVVTLVLPLVVVVASQFTGRTRSVIEPILGWFH